MLPKLVPQVVEASKLLQQIRHGKKQLISRRLAVGLDLRQVFPRAPVPSVAFLRFHQLHDAQLAHQPFHRVLVAATTYLGFRVCIKHLTRHKQGDVVFVVSHENVVCHCPNLDAFDLQASLLGRLTLSGSQKFLVILQVSSRELPRT